MIRKATTADAQAICEIYNYYVLHTIITFEEEAVNVKEMEERIRVVILKYPWFVYEENGEVIGYAYCGEWKSRCAYRYSVESSIYLKNGISGRGIGSRLYEALFSALKNTDIHGVIGGISLPNEASIALHEKFGFHKIGQFKEVGFKFNYWIDVGYWERIMNNKIPKS